MLLLVAHTARAQNLSFDEVERLPAPPADRRIAYGDGPLQFGDLRLPQGRGPHPVVVVIHGGRWYSEYDLKHVANFSAALTRTGVATWSLEYRRIGDAGGGWPGTFEDVARGLDYLRVLARTHREAHTLTDLAHLIRVVVRLTARGGTFMRRFLSSTLTIFLLGAALACGAAVATDTTRVAIPNPALDSPLQASRGEQKAVLAGGCFWGVEAVFAHVKGVIDVKVGYSGGTAKTADYETVSTGRTGHAESVQITYDPSQITYGQLLKVFFAVAHDPTELNRQGPDSGPQYRSAIFYSDEEQKRVAFAYVTQLNQAKVFARPVVTQVVRLDSFYPAEAYHQDYAATHPDDSYIVYNDLPKVENLRKQFPELYSSR